MRRVEEAHKPRQKLRSVYDTRKAPQNTMPTDQVICSGTDSARSSAIAAIRFEPVSGTLLLSGISAGRASENPLRWRSRRKAVVTLPKGEVFDPHVDDVGQFPQIRMDMGRLIAARPRPLYPNDAWGKSYNNKLPGLSDREVLVEYTSHPDARFHLSDGSTVPVARLEEKGRARRVRVVEPATQRVTLKVIEKATGRPVAVKLHVHGAEGEYLAPVERHRVPNSMWFQDYSVDFAHVDPEAASLGVLVCRHVFQAITVSETDFQIGAV